jgi:voltage-gated potassium channel
VTVRERLGAPPAGCEEREFDDWLRAASERADPFMAWLGVVFALLVVFEIAVDLEPATSSALQTAGWVIWAVFLAEFLARLWLAPRRGRFLRRHWPTVLGLLVPALRAFAFLRLLRIGRALPAARVVSSSYRATGTARRLLQSRLGYLVAVSSVVCLALAQLAYLFERGHGTFATFGDALLWAFAVVVATQGDPLPESVPARVAMSVGYVWGLVVIASLAGTLGAFWVDDRRERAGSGEG